MHWRSRITSHVQNRAALIGRLAGRLNKIGCLGCLARKSFKPKLPGKPGSHLFSGRLPIRAASRF
jgi:hypothetical protein